VLARKFIVTGLGLIVFPQTIAFLIAVGHGLFVGLGWIHQSPVSVQPGMHNEMQLLMVVLVLVVIPQYIGWFLVVAGGIIYVRSFICRKPSSSS
jgi:hypothetical protein